MRRSYIALHESGKLRKRIEAAWKLLENCRLCPRSCGVNRLAGQRGLCRTGEKAVVASYGPHFGEEQPLVGSGGSGTIFFGHCNLLCVFCQNYDISHCPEGEAGEEVGAEQLARMMLDLQEQGCHNINFVTPSHVVPQIIQALLPAIEGGLHLPLVYNTSGYDRVETLQLLEGIIDIYMPDFKFWSKESSKRYMKAQDYPEHARRALREMHRQVGDLLVNDGGLAERGLLIRHLVMPGGLAETKAILEFIAREISTGSYLNIMDQYHPCGRADEFEELNRTLTGEEFRQALQYAAQYGLERLDQRDFSSLLKRLGL